MVDGKVFKYALVSRFFVSNRIPASTLGFFVGHAEKYKSPLYKTLGKFWVVYGLMDNYFRPHREQYGAAANGNTDASENQIKIFNNLSYQVKQLCTIDNEADKMEVEVGFDGEENEHTRKKFRCTKYSDASS
jgi:hypothetical protein